MLYIYIYIYRQCYDIKHMFSSTNTNGVVCPLASEDSCTAVPERLFVSVVWVTPSVFPLPLLITQCRPAGIPRPAGSARSDAGRLGFESQTGPFTGEPIPSLRRDKHPAIKGLRPLKHHAGHSVRTKNTIPSQTT